MPTRYMRETSNKYLLEICPEPRGRCPGVSQAHAHFTREWAKDGGMTPGQVAREFDLLYIAATTREAPTPVERYHYLGVN